MSVWNTSTLAQNNLYASEPEKGDPMADDRPQTELERLRAENTALKGQAAKGLTLKIDEKGAARRI